MKYLEEINPGDTFSIDNNLYLLTIDFKKNGDRLCYILSSGCPKWMESKTVVNSTPIYYLDKDNNVIPIKITERQDAILNKA